jgi:glutathione S-transferase
MKLFFSPGACSLSPHIAMREAGLAVELAKVDLRARKLEDGSDYTLINPKGYVPALGLDEGGRADRGPRHRPVHRRSQSRQRPGARLPARWPGIGCRSG